MKYLIKKIVIDPQSSSRANLNALPQIPQQETFDEQQFTYRRRLLVRNNIRNSENPSRRWNYDDQDALQEMQEESFERFTYIRRTPVG